MRSQVNDRDLLCLITLIVNMFLLLICREEEFNCILIANGNV